MSEKIIFFDTETTGMTRGPQVFLGHRIVEVAFLHVTESESFEEYQQYLNPMQPVSPEALAVHGLKNEFLEDFPKFEECAPQIIEQMKGAVLIAHNAPFDLAFLDYELNRVGFGPVRSYCADVIDTLVIARKKFPGQKNSLDALCQRFGISLINRAFHGGLKDCYLLSQVYRALHQGQRFLDFTANRKSNNQSQAMMPTFSLPLCALTPEEILSHENFIAKHLS